MKSQVAYLLLVPGSVTCLWTSSFMCLLSFYGSMRKKIESHWYLVQLTSFYKWGSGAQKINCFTQGLTEVSRMTITLVLVVFPLFLSNYEFCLHLQSQATGSFKHVTGHSYSSAEVPVGQKWRILFPQWSLEPAENVFPIGWVRRGDVCLFQGRLVFCSDQDILLLRESLLFHL